MLATKSRPVSMRDASLVMARPHFPAWLMVGLLVLVTVLAYEPAWHAGFIWDDDEYVTNNPLLTAPDGLQRIWFSLDSPSQYFPLTYTVFRIQHALWGLMPAGYHWVNILLHAMNALLVWRLLQRLSVPGARLAAAIFALHPVQVESVAWVTELKSVLSLFFILLTLLAWLEFIEKPSKPAWRWYLLALACHALALAAKTTACTLPAALLLILWLKHKAINWPRLAQMAPFLAMGVGMGLLTIWWERYHQGTQGNVFVLNLLERLLVASHALWFYLGKLMWPANLTFSYPRWNINCADPLAYGWTVAGMGLGAVIYLLRQFVGRGLEVAMLFYAAMLSPLLGFIMLYTFLYTFVADHYQYAACIGPIALTAAGVIKAFEKWGKGKPVLKPVFCGALLLALGVLTWRQSRMYADTETLWQATIERNPASWMAHNNLANALVQKGRLDEGIMHFQGALAIRPVYAEAHYNLGIALFRKGQVDEAIIQFQSALTIRPAYPEAHYNLGYALYKYGQTDEAIRQYQEAIRLKPGDAEAHNNFGLALFSKGQTGEAISQYQEAIRLKPDDAEAHNNLGLALFGSGQTDEAISQYQAAIRFQPDDAEAHYNLGIALFRKGQADEAISHFNTATRLKPDYAEAHNNLGTTLLQTGRVDEAINQFQKALAIQPHLVLAQNNLAHIAWVLATSPDPPIRNGAKAVELAELTDRLSSRKRPVMAGTLAAAYAETGRFPEAITTAQRALRLANSQTNAALVAALEAQLKLYQAGFPFRDTGASR